MELKEGLKNRFSIRPWKPSSDDDNFVFPTSLTSSHSFSWQVGRNWRGKRKAMVCLYECNFEYELETIGSFNEIGRRCVRVYTREPDTFVHTRFLPIVEGNVINLIGGAKIPLQLPLDTNLVIALRAN